MKNTDKFDPRLVEQWFIDRNLVDADPRGQVLKFIEEFGEYASGVARNNEAEIIDAIGDMLVVIIGLSLQLDVQLDFDEVNLFHADVDDVLLALRDITLKLYNYDIKLSYTTFDDLQSLLATTIGLSASHGLDWNMCLASAYNEIKDRKGKLINGVFVKEI